MQHPKTVTFATVQGGTFQSAKSQTQIPITVDSASDPVIYKFWSYDGGLTVYMQYI